MREDSAPLAPYRLGSYTEAKFIQGIYLDKVSVYPNCYSVELSVCTITSTSVRAPGCLDSYYLYWTSNKVSHDLTTTLYYFSQSDVEEDKSGSSLGGEGVSLVLRSKEGSDLHLV